MLEKLTQLFSNKELDPAKAEKLADNSESMGWAEESTWFEKHKWNPDSLIGRKGFQIYKDMMIDEQIKAVVHFKRSAIIGRSYTFDFPAGSQRDLSEDEATRRIEMFNHMLTDAFHGEFSDGLKNILKAMWQGYSMTEIIYGKYEFQDKTHIGLRDLRQKPFETFEAQVNEFGDVLNWIQKANQKEQIVDMDRFVYYRYNQDMDEHYGRSELWQAYRSYLAKDTIIHYMNIFVERLAGGFVVMKPKEGHSVQTGTPEWENLKKILKNITGQASVFLPSKVEMDVHSVSGNQVEVFARAIEIHDLAIAKALLMPNLLGLSHTGQTGAYSQSETQFDVFIIISDEEARSLADALNEQIFGPLGKLNFADGVVPKFMFKPLSERKKMQMLETWGNLLQKGAVQATETDMEHVRELLDFPEAGEPVEPPAAPASSPEAPAGVPARTPTAQGQPTVNQTITGTPVKIVNTATMARAEQRVSFQVIAKQAQDKVDETVERMEQSFLDLISDAVAEIEANNLGSDPTTAKAIAALSFNGFRVRNLKAQTARGLKDGYRIGIRHSARELDSAKGENFSRRIDNGRLGDLATEFFDSKAFTISGDLTAAALKEIKNVLSNGLKYSWAFRGIKRKIYVTLMERGFISARYAADALGFADIAAMAEELGVATGVTAHRMETVMRTSMFEAINEARFNTFTDPVLGDFVTALEYSAILDNRTTAICNHLDGRVYSASDPVWDRYRPPNHFNCRSILIAVTEIDERPVTSDLPQLSPQEGFG